MRWVRRNVHLLLAIVWTLLLVPALTVWQDSILFVILMSIYANVAASLSAHEAKKDGHAIDRIDEKVTDER